jgi:hypothetical protein
MPTNKGPHVLTWKTAAEIQALLRTKVKQSPQGISRWGDQGGDALGTIVKTEETGSTPATSPRSCVVWVRWPFGGHYWYCSGEIQTAGEDELKNTPVKQGLLELWPPEILMWSSTEAAATFIGTRVRLSQRGLDDFGNQSKGSLGTIRSATHRWVCVEWDSGEMRSYRSGDLVGPVGGK